MSTETPLDLAPIMGASIAAVSTIVGVLLANWFNSKSISDAHDRAVATSRNEMKLAKIEELYMAMFQWQKKANGIYIVHFSYYCEKLTYEQVNKMVTQEIKDSAGMFDSLTMIVNVHFPELKDDLKLVLDMRNRMGRYIHEDSRGQFSLNEFSSDNERFDVACNAFLDKLSSIAKELYV